MWTYISYNRISRILDASASLRIKLVIEICISAAPSIYGLVKLWMAAWWGSWRSRCRRSRDSGDWAGTGNWIFCCRTNSDRPLSAGPSSQHSQHSQHSQYSQYSGTDWKQSFCPAIKSGHLQWMNKCVKISVLIRHYLIVSVDRQCERQHGDHDAEEGDGDEGDDNSGNECTASL